MKGGMMADMFRLLIVGPRDNVLDVMKHEFMFKTLRFVPKPYQSSDEAPMILKRYRDQFDGVLFTGPIPYLKASHALRENIPMVHISFGGKALYRALFDAVRQGQQLVRISVDTIDQQEVVETLEELGLSPESLRCLQYSRAIADDEFVNFHADLYRRKEIDLAFTCLRSAHERLVEMGVPVIRIMPPRSHIVEALQAIELMRARLNDETDHVVVAIVEPCSIDESAYTTFEIYEKLLELERLLLKFSHDVQGTLTRGIRNQYVTVTTRSFFEKATDSLTSMPLIAKIKRHTSLDVLVGVGVANTASSAGYHATLALQKAKELGTGSCFVCLPNTVVLGPLGIRDVPSMKLRVTEPEILELSRNSGLSPPLVDKAIATLKEVGEGSFTTYDLAMKLGMSLRNARRILQHLSAQGVVELIGKEMIAARGKPRNVYRLASRYLHSV